MQIKIVRTVGILIQLPLMKPILPHVTRLRLFHGFERGDLFFHDMEGGLDLENLPVLESILIVSSLCLMLFVVKHLLFSEKF